MVDAVAKGRGLDNVRQEGFLKKGIGLYERIAHAWTCLGEVYTVLDFLVSVKGRVFLVINNSVNNSCWLYNCWKS